MSLNVSAAITSSSFVHVSVTFTLDSGVEITVSAPLTDLFPGSVTGSVSYKVTLAAGSDIDPTVSSAGLSIDGNQAGWISTGPGGDSVTIVASGPTQAVWIIVAAAAVVLIAAVALLIFRRRIMAAVRARRHKAD